MNFREASGSLSYRHTYNVLLGVRTIIQQCLNLYIERVVPIDLLSSRSLAEPFRPAFLSLAVHRSRNLHDIAAYEETSSEDPSAASDPYYSNPYDPYNPPQSVDPTYQQNYPSSGRKLNEYLSLKRIGGAVENLWSKATNALNR